MDSLKILKRKLIITFSIMIVLIFVSGILGWIFTQQIENSNKIVEVVHLFKESELQLRREEKNLLIRGYSQPRYLRWQKANEDFHRDFGTLIGLNALNNTEIDEIKSEYSEMSDTYTNFFNDIRLNVLSQKEIVNYDEQFKKIGRRTLEMINNILVREQKISSSSNLNADILIMLFLAIFIASAGYLIVNIIKHI